MRLRSALLRQTIPQVFPDSINITHYFLDPYNTGVRLITSILVARFRPKTASFTRLNHFCQQQMLVRRLEAVLSTTNPSEVGYVRQENPT
jgi:hypothetical protein